MINSPSMDFYILCIVFQHVLFSSMSLFYFIHSLWMDVVNVFSDYSRQYVSSDVRACCIAGRGRGRGSVDLWGVHLSHPAPGFPVSTAPGFAVLPPAGNNGFSSQDRDMSGSWEVSRAPAGSITVGQPVWANQHPVTWFTVEVPMTSDWTVIFTWRTE